MTKAEASSIYLKSLLSDCVGAVVIHVDMKNYSIVLIENLSLEDLSASFSKAEAIGRLSSFFDLLRKLKEGNFVYCHGSLEAHGVIYEESKNEHIQADLSLNQDCNLTLSSYISPVNLSRTQLTAWQRHNCRLPLCYHPRRSGTYLCHEYLSRDGECSKTLTCAFAHLSKKQLEIELGPVKYERYMADFAKPKEDKVGKKKNTSNFGKVINNKQSRGKKFKAKKNVINKLKILNCF